MSRSAHPRHRPSPALVQRVERLVDGEQRTIPSLAAELGVSPEAVRRVLRWLGVRFVRVPLSWCGWRRSTQFVEVVRGGRP